VSADYSQVELRIMAHISEDENLLRAFAGGRTSTAPPRRRFSDARSRRHAGGAPLRQSDQLRADLRMSAFGLAQQLGLERATAQAYIASYFHPLPAVAKYMEETRKTARERGYVETVFAGACGCRDQELQSRAAAGRARRDQRAPCRARPAT